MPEGCARGVERFDTPDWGQPGGIELRTDAAGAALLLRHRTAADAVYRYDAATRTLDRRGESDWSGAGGEIVDCDLAAAAPTAPFTLDARERTVRFGDRPVTLAGSTALALCCSGRRPRGRAVGGRCVPWFRRAGDGLAGTSGQHYQQVLGRHDGTTRGPAVDLPLTSASVALTGCWSADGRYVAWADVLFNHLCIVDANASGGDAR